MTTSCPHCGWPDAEPYQVISRRLTRDSTQLSWARCACGSLQMRQQPPSGIQAVLTRGRPTPDLAAPAHQINRTSL